MNHVASGQNPDQLFPGRLPVFARLRDPPRRVPLAKPLNKLANVFRPVKVYPVEFDGLRKFPSLGSFVPTGLAGWHKAQNVLEAQKASFRQGGGGVGHNKCLRIGWIFTGAYDYSGGDSK